MGKRSMYSQIMGMNYGLALLSGGLVKLDKTTEEMTFYNHANSGLPHNGVSALAIDGSNNCGSEPGVDWRGLMARTGQTYYTSNSALPDNYITVSCNRW